MSGDIRFCRQVGPMVPPEYFFEIREKAQIRWQQLEADPELAGPWHQLFKQVQSPRHVVSELLQNADDAGATQAQVRILDGEFVFAHNGEDFTREHFASLCRFGYSNKRSLHTIGFRGVGFKSTFSLGDEVRLRTPSLSIAFFRERFSEPVWMDNDYTQRTEIRVVIKDEYRQKEIEKNLEEWLTSPASLLFFNAIRHFRVGRKEVHWKPVGTGPIPGSHWMASSGEVDKKYLVIRSGEKQFPPEAVEEIRQERMVSTDDETSFPPCRVEIVLGMEGRLFVILPTGVRTELPFACNAPFIQDPARLKIKDPETSPTNRWLLKRAGRLAAQAMVTWLHRGDVPIDHRCAAYSLLPDIDRDNTIEGTSGSIVEEAFLEAIEDKEILLTEDDKVVRENECVSVPRSLLEIWTTEQVSTLFVVDVRPILSRHISSDDLQKLRNWQLIDSIDKRHILDVLAEKHLPRPRSWRQLLTLWAYVSEDVRETYYGQTRQNLRIIPVQGKDVLYAAHEVVRLSEKRLLHSDEDWNFLSEYLLVVNQNWPRFLAEQRRKADDEKNDALRREWTAAHGVLNSLGLDDSSDVSRVIEKVAEQAFAKDEYPVEGCVRLAQIAAKLDATVTHRFRFVTQDGCRNTINDIIVADVDGDLDQFVDEQWYAGHVLHEDYSLDFKSCSKNEWQQWIASGRSKLLTFIPLSNSRHQVWTRREVEDLLRKRGVTDEPSYYKRCHFVVDDWDFDSRHWKHWNKLANDDGAFWTKVVARILKQPPSFVSEALYARVLQVASNGWEKPVTGQKVRSAWLTKLRELPCLLDTRGQCRQPAELLRRTPETEALLDVELFVRAEDDNEHSRPLLKRLGVRDTPTGPDRLLERLRALADVDDPPIYEIEKWYHRLDQLFVKCSTDEAGTIKDTFASEGLILTSEGNWLTTPEVFLNAADDDVPGAPIVHPSVRHLTMWYRIGVADRPTADLAIKWLQELLSGEKLAADELRRIRSLLPRFPERIWDECEHWLSLDGRWAKVSSLDYSLAMQSLIPWGHLFDPIKQRTADFRGLDAETSGEPPFRDLPTLASRIEDQFQDNLYGLTKPLKKPWLKTLGEGIARIEIDHDDEQREIHEIGHRLASTSWQVATGLESVPYIDGTPAGTPRRTEVLWKGTTLYVEDRPIPQLFKSIIQELARASDRADIGEAIKACVERSPEFILEYLEENFTLVPLEKVESPTTGDAETDEPISDESLTAQTTDSFESEDDVDASEPESDDLPDDEAVWSEEGESEGELADGSADEDQGENADQPRPTKTHIRKTAKPGLIEVMATAMGFEKDGTDRFFHADGSWIHKAAGNTFPWERYAASGELAQSYWTNECCIQREPLQLDAVIWNLCEKFPDRYSIVLRDVDDTALLLSGSELTRLRAEGQLILHAANYRLVYRDASSLGQRGRCE